MNKVIPRRPAGFMELLPAEQIKFNQMIETVKHTYELFGFAPIETPAIEYSEILLAKSGGETEKQVYSFERGDKEYCLHWDLTVPLARYVSEHYNDLTFPFRRYQIQKVWRAERPQKGRFRELYQADIDIIGSNDLTNDAEMIQVIYTTFNKLNLGKFIIRLNNRQVLNGLYQAYNIQKPVETMRIIDKLPKLGKEKVTEELRSIGLDDKTITNLIDFVSYTGSNSEIINFLKGLPIDNPTFSKGIADLKTLINITAKMAIPEEYYQIDLSIARGLDYYTGTVYETFLLDSPEFGSVCSGGRYDNLTSYYMDKNLSGIGISIGLTRLFDQMLSKGTLELNQSSPAKVLVTQFDPNLKDKYLEILNQLRQTDVPSMIYTEETSLGNQIKYANKLGIPYVIIIGETEAKNNQIALKNMASGDQQILSISDAIRQINQQ